VRVSARARAGARSKRTGRKPGQTSPKIRAAARANGAKHKRDRLPDDVIERLGQPPPTENELHVWNARTLAEIQWLAMRGLISSELASTLRANAGAIERALPERPKLPPKDDEDDDEDFDEDDDPDLEDEGAGGDSQGCLRIE
jgi:hypothetical protein